MELMLRICFVRHWFTLSEPAMGDGVYESTSVRRFLKLDSLTDSVPDESTMLRFRHLLQAHALAGKLFESVNADLVDKGLLLRGGSMVGSTLIAAPGSTKNQEPKQDPEMRSTKKGNDWHFGMKLHIGVCVHSGLAHRPGARTAKVQDSAVFADLVREDDQAVFGDKGYVNNKLKKCAPQHGLYWGVLDKPGPKRTRSARQKQGNKKLASIRVNVEHPFRVIKQHFGYRKTRYRGIYKNGQQLFALLLSANLYLAQRKLMDLLVQCA